MPFPIAVALGLAAEFAPTLVRHLAGDKAGDVADKIADTAMAVTGAATPDAAAEALRANPEVAVKFRTDMANIELAIEREYLADRKNARDRDERLRLAGRGNSRADVMLGLAFLAVIVIAVVLAMGGVDANSAIAGFLIGIGGMFARNIGSAFDFEFGSSRGSKEKDNLLAALGNQGR